MNEEEQMQIPLLHYVTSVTNKDTKNPLMPLQGKVKNLHF